jgi:hypothetical protein
MPSIEDNAAFAVPFGRGSIGSNSWTLLPLKCATRSLKWRSAASRSISRSLPMHQVRRRLWRPLCVRSLRADRAGTLGGLDDVPRYHRDQRLDRAGLSPLECCLSQDAGSGADDARCRGAADRRYRPDQSVDHSGRKPASGVRTAGGGRPIAVRGAENDRRECREGAAFERCRFDRSRAPGRPDAAGGKSPGEYRQHPRHPLGHAGLASACPTGRRRIADGSRLRRSRRGWVRASRPRRARPTRFALF